MEFSEKLKLLRSQRNISQAKLAEEIHISRSAVAKWENGLGLPGSDSLQMLADYFDLSVSDLLPDQDNAEVIINKNQTIVQQKNLIYTLLALMGIGAFVLIYIFIEPLRGVLDLIGLGVIFIILGIFNIKGNIASIHWYNRRKVTKENQRAYCMFIGTGTTIMGIALILSAITQIYISIETGAVITMIGTILGLILMVYAQIKYNRGIF